MSPAPGPPSRRARVGRHPERARYDGATVRAILDEALICDLGFVDRGRPFVVPTMFARRQDAVYVHGSPASRMLRQAVEGVEVCLTVTLLDGLVLARSAFSHSMNYRSVMLLGRAVEVASEAEKMLAFEALIEHVCRGRWSDARRPDRKELAATRVLRLDLREASAKVRSGPPKDSRGDLGLPVWAGEIPLRLRPLAPVSDAPLGRARPAPAYAAAYRRPGW